MRVHLLFLIALALPLGASKCEQCCQEADGSTFVSGTCPQDTTVISEKNKNTSSADFETTCNNLSTTSSGDVSCESFCAAVEAACPTDTECLHSCQDLATKAPTGNDVKCAENAESCDDTNACFSALF